MDRVFLDANILFSTAYRPEAEIKKLWDLKRVKLISSTYALQEAKANLATLEQQSRLDQLTQELEVISPSLEQALPAGIDLPEKDRPIFLAALKAKATHLLTGDFRHFGKYYGMIIANILILPPGDYLVLIRKYRILAGLPRIRESLSPLRG